MNNLMNEARTILLESIEYYDNQNIKTFLENKIVKNNIQIALFSSTG